MTTDTTQTQTPTQAFPSAAILILRAAVGGVFAAHGAQKLFEFTPAGTAASFAEMGVPLSSVAGPAVAILEFVGGILLILGVFSRPIAALLALDMIGAIAFVHAPAGFWANAGGWEFVAVLAVVAAAIALAGPGRYALAEVLLPRRLRVVLG